MKRTPGGPSLLTWILVGVAYRIDQVNHATRRTLYRLGLGRCYRCPGRHGRHKFSCPVGAKESLK